MSMKNRTKIVGRPKTAKYTNSSGSTQLAGTIVRVGQNYGRLKNDVLNGGTNGIVDLLGVVVVTKTANLEAFAKGDRVYFNGQEPTKVPQGFAAGEVYAAAISSATTVDVLFDPSALKPYFVKRPVTAAEAIANEVVLTPGVDFTNYYVANSGILDAINGSARGSGTVTVDAGAGTVTLANAGIVDGDYVRLLMNF